MNLKYFEKMNNACRKKNILYEKMLIKLLLCWPKSVFKKYQIVATTQTKSFLNNSNF